MKKYVKLEVSARPPSLIGYKNLNKVLFLFLINANSDTSYLESFPYPYNGSFINNTLVNKYLENKLLNLSI
ncbi:hypothetical protein CN472_26805 [Bacillus thuringiensis]|nr:hypothetical protein CN472_26805 [Bacillus thuringiensis]